MLFFLAYLFNGVACACIFDCFYKHLCKQFCLTQSFFKKTRACHVIVCQQKQEINSVYQAANMEIVFYC